MPARKRSIPILISVSSFVLTLALFTPARIFIGNFMEFSSLFPESVLFFLIVSLGLVLVFFTAALGVSRRETTCRAVVSVLTAAAFAMWVQGNLFLWPYGVLNGTDIDWDALLWYGFIDAVFWSVVMTISILRADLVFKVIGKAGTRALTRVMGLLGSAYAVQMILDGVTGYVGSF